MPELVAVTCKACGEVMPSGLLVCGECGIPFAPLRFTPPSLVDEPPADEDLMLDLGLGADEHPSEGLPAHPDFVELAATGPARPLSRSMPRGREIALIVAGAAAVLVVWGCAGMVLFSSLRLAGVL